MVPFKREVQCISLCMMRNAERSLHVVKTWNLTHLHTGNSPWYGMVQLMSLVPGVSWCLYYEPDTGFHTLAGLFIKLCASHTWSLFIAEDDSYFTQFADKSDTCFPVSILGFIYVWQCVCESCQNQAKILSSSWGTSRFNYLLSYSLKIRFLSKLFLW